MKKWILMALVALFWTGSLSAQDDKGAVFVEDTFANVLKMSKDSGKPIFLDVYTTWCGPCKQLSEKIFPAEVVGEYMNQTFVNTKFDAEKGEGINIRNRYNVQGYPTMLILNSKGEELGRLVGSSRTPEDFVKRLKEEMTKIEKK